MKNKGLKLAVVAIVVGMFLSGAVCTVSAQAKSKEELEARLRGMEQKKQQEQANRMKSTDADRPTGQDLDAAITKHEKLIDGCAVKMSGERCAYLMYTLGVLYYDQARERFDRASELHAKAMKQYDRTKRGNPPTPPVPDYSKSLKMYWQLSREYPNFPKLPEAYYQMSQNYLVEGHIDTVRILLEQLVVKFPNSPHVSAARFRLGELAFIDNNFNKAYEYFRAYVNACNRNKYEKCEFREAALKYMSETEKAK